MLLSNLQSVCCSTLQWEFKDNPQFEMRTIRFSKAEQKLKENAIHSPAQRNYVYLLQVIPFLSGIISHIAEEACYSLSLDVPRKTHVMGTGF